MAAPLSDSALTKQEEEKKESSERGKELISDQPEEKGKMASGNSMDNDGVSGILRRIAKADDRWVGECRGEQWKWQWQ